MVDETSNPDDQLLPARHSKGDLFICDVADAVLKDIMPQMEHPFYSLSKNPATTVRRYEHNGNWLEIVPSVKGQATIYDKDILIYCISQVMEKLKRREPISPRLRIISHDLLVFANRGTAGKDYDALCGALDRLEGTRIKTNIRTGDEETRDSFGLIDASSVQRKHGLDGRLLWVEVKLSDWVFNAIRSQGVLTLNRDYFRLGKPLERRVYELARKHCGRQSKWSISLEILLKKSGSQSSIKQFRQMLKHIAKHDHLPDYRVMFDEGTDQVTFYNRESWWQNAPVPAEGETLPPLPAPAYEDGRAAAPGYDIHALEGEWREFWASSGRPKLDNPAAAFVGFCRNRHRRAPIQRKSDSDWESARTCSFCMVIPSGEQNNLYYNCFGPFGPKGEPTVQGVGYLYTDVGFLRRGSMRQRRTLRQRIEARIARRQGEVVFLPREFRDLGDGDQVVRVLRGLVRERRLMSLGYGVYGRAVISRVTGEAMLYTPDGLRGAARQALTKLGVTWDRSGAGLQRASLNASTCQSGGASKGPVLATAE